MKRWIACLVVACVSGCASVESRDASETIAAAEPEKICKEDQIKKLKPEELGRHQCLRRGNGHVAISELAVPEAIRTECDVTLADIVEGSNCSARAIFEPGDKIGVKGQGDTFQLVHKRGSVVLLTASLSPKPTARRPVYWEAQNGERTLTYYVYLERYGDGLAKRYRIEAFEKNGGSACQGERPDNAIGNTCEIPRTIIPMKAMEADTGGGHEPPVD